MSTATQTIEAQVMEATGVKPKDGEDRGKFLLRLASAADTKLTDEQWGEMSTEAQDWVNAAMTAKNEKEPAPEPDGKAAADDDDDEAAEEPKAEAPAANGKRRRGESKEDAPKAEKKEKKDSGRTKRTDKGATDDFCRLVLKHPDEDLDALLGRFAKTDAAIGKARAASVRRSTLRVLRCQK